MTGSVLPLQLSTSSQWFGPLLAVTEAGVRVPVPVTETENVKGLPGSSEVAVMTLVSTVHSTSPNSSMSEVSSASWSAAASSLLVSVPTAVIDTSLVFIVTL